MTECPAIPVFLYAKPNGLVNMVLVEVDSPWGDIGNAMADAGVEYSIEELDPDVSYIVSAEYGDQLLVYDFSDLKNKPMTQLVKQAYAVFMG
jgi:hypothetical protein